jgi:hypothetical protein
MSGSGSVFGGAKTGMGAMQSAENAFAPCLGDQAEIIGGDRLGDIRR